MDRRLPQGYVVTVIAYDGKRLACDSGVSLGRICQPGVKWREFHKDGQKTIMVLAGSSLRGIEMMDWYESGCLAPFPERDDEEDDATLIVAESDGLFEYWNRGTRMTVDPDGKYAWGCGYEVALGALHAGANATKACHVACKLVSGCLPPVRTWKLR